MLQNPFLAIPQVESPSSRSWESGFLYGFQGPEASAFTQEDVQTEDTDAFSQGVLAGQNAAIGGLDLGAPCIDLNVEGPSAAHFAVDAGAESIFAVATFLGKHFMGYTAEGIIAIVNLSIALETFSDDPDTALMERGDRLQAALTNLGFTEPLTLYIGGGVDLNAPGCELKVTPIFRRQSDAVAAARAMGRDRWLVGAWRTDQCGGLEIVESAGF